MSSFAPIAIVGQSCLLPGASSPAELWQHCVAGRSLLSAATPERWRADPWRVMREAGGVAADWPGVAGYVKGFTPAFDPRGLAMAPADILAFDPLVHWLLHTAREALSSTAVASGARIGAVLGNLMLPSEGLSNWAEDVWMRQQSPAVQGMLNARPQQKVQAADRFMSGLPGQIMARALELTAGCTTIDAACASSLYALKLACDRLHDGSADLMLAGAVSRVDPLFLHIGFGALQALSPTSQTRPFHRQADGLVPAEGAAMVALKRLADAEAAGDVILGVIRAVGLANDGRSSGLLVPAVAGQVSAMRQAYAQADLSPRDIGLLECHATGTPVGDRTEIASLAQVFPGYGQLPAASLKGNLGHTITVAGMAALIKVLGSMAADTFAPSLGADEPLPELATSPLRLLQQAEPWQGPKRAGINAFGFGGNNAHVIVEDHATYRAVHPKAGTSSRPLAPEQTATTGSPHPRQALSKADIAVVSLGVIAGGGQNVGDFAAALGAGGQHALPAAAIGFDYSQLRFPPNDLLAALPQQTLLLRAALQATAGLGPLDRDRTGIFIGMQCDSEIARHGWRARLPQWLAAEAPADAATTNWIAQAQLAGSPHLGAPAVVGSLPNIVANRLNAQFDVAGPSFVVSAEELSGTDALRLAIRALQVGELDTAIVGAVDLSHEEAHLAAAAELSDLAPLPAGDAAVVMVLRRAGNDAPLAMIPAHTPDVAPGLVLGNAHGDQLAALFGHAHAASGLLHVAAAVVCGQAGSTACVQQTALGGAYDELWLTFPTPKQHQTAATSPSNEALFVPSHAPLLRLPEPPSLTPSTRPLPAGGPATNAPFADFLRGHAAAHAAYLQAMSSQQHVHAAYLDTATRALVPTVVLRAAPAGKARPAAEAPFLSRADLEVLASGSIASVLGPEFAGQELYTRQVRMPMPPLLLADRVLAIDAPAGVLGTGTIHTATDITPDAWYLHQGHMPAGILIESGQADLLLISWMGIDQFNKSERVYRLLGCELTYHGGLPAAGETLSYAIHIDGHAQQGERRLFFFHYDCWAGERLCLSVRGGQAGFFSDQELADSAGVLWDAATATPTAEGTVASKAVPALRASFDAQAVAAFAAGQTYSCFGPGYEAAQTHTSPPRIQDGSMLLMGAVTHLDDGGGPWQRGYLRSELPIHADDWFFTGHFKNDPCMPGTLMFEGGLQAMAFYIAALGFTLDKDGWRFEPVEDTAYALRCRGQVRPSSQLVTYEIFVDELTIDPYPILYADILCTVDGLKAFHCRRMGLRLIPDVPINHPVAAPLLAAAASPVEASWEAEGMSFGYRSLLETAWGWPADAFGPRFAAVPPTRRLPHLPGPPYHFMTRVTSITGDLTQAAVGSTVDVAYDVPADAWYFAAQPSQAMPYCVLLEVALQPCGWMACYSGLPLSTEQDLFFRNLDGEAVQHRLVTAATGTLRTHAELTNVARAGGMILLSFNVICRDDVGPVFSVVTKFGFFQPAALAAQVGIPVSAERRAAFARPSDVHVALRHELAGRTGNGRLALPESMLLMVDRITGYWREESGLARIRGEKDVRPDDWFFKAHFFQDPVQPGSLGLEAILQLLQYYAIEEKLGESYTDPCFEVLAVETAPVVWKYRGQVLPSNQLITVDATIVGIDEDQKGLVVTAHGTLWRDGLLIYEASGLKIRITP